MNKIKLNINKTIVIATGGTGGHISPALSIIEKLIDYNIIIITDIRGKDFLKKFHNTKNDNLNYNLIVHNITSPNKKGFINKTKSFSLILLSTIKCLKLFLFNKPELIIGFGGYSSTTPLLAARLLKIPIIIHEQNAVLGRANRFLSKFSNTLALSFNKTKFNKSYNKSIFTGNPVREEFNIIGNSKYIPPKKEKKFSILIMGGSLGAGFLSNEITSILCSLPIKFKKRLVVFHQVKEEQLSNVQNLYKKNKINSEVRPFFQDIFKYFKKSDLIISRSGGSSIAEILASNRPAIFFPLPSSLDNHQDCNAKFIAHSKAGWLLDQKKTSSQFIIKFLKSIMLNPKKLEDASKEIKKISSHHLDLCENKTPTDFFINIIEEHLSIREDLKS